MPFLSGLDSRETYFLISIGVLFALSGLYLMIQPPRGDGATRIEVLGLKFNASSGGLVVFLIGAAFVGLPVLVPAGAAVVAPSGAATRVVAVAPEVAPASLPGPSAVRSAGGEFITLRRADATEVEENDDQFTANHIAVGSAISGRVAYGDADWYAFPVDSAQGEKVALRVRSIEKSRNCTASVFNDREERVWWDWFVDAPAARNTSVVVAQNAHLMVRIAALDDAQCEYALLLDYE